MVPMELQNLIQFLLLIVCFLVSIFYIKFRWSRRNLYKLANKITNEGPSYPVIGSAIFFMGPPRELQIKINKEMDKCYPSLIKAWLGTRFFVAISQPEYLEIILNNKHCLNKSDEYTFFEMMVGHGLITAKAELWKKNRKLIQPTFNQKILNQFVQTFVEKSEIFVDVLKKYAGKGEFDVYLPVSLCTLDNILETGIGIKVGAQTTNFQYSQWVSRCLEFVLERIAFVPFHFDFIFYLSPQGKEFSKLMKKLQHFIETVVKEKRKEFDENQNTLEYNESGRQKTFLDLLLELEDGGTHFTNKQIIDEVQTMIGAATDTTASTSSYILIMLGMFPELQQKVYNEIVNTIGHDRSVTVDDLSNFTYMEMFIKETLRLFPSAPLMARQPTQNIKLGTTIIPAGTCIFMTILHTHRNGRIWKDPLKFDPERFLPEECSKRHPYSYLPFSGGPRSCIGPKYAMMLLKTLFATIVRKYKISTSYKNIEDIELGSDIVLRAKKGYNISIEERCF